MNCQGLRRQLRQPRFDRPQGLVARIALAQRDVLDEALYAPTVGPRVVGREQPGPHGRRHPFGVRHGHAQRSPGKGVAALHRQPTKQRGPANANPQRNGGRTKGCRVHQHEADEAVGLGQRRARADRAAPIVGHQCHASQVQLAHQVRQILHVLSKAIRIAGRLVAQPAADVVDGNHAERGAPARDQLAPVKRPGGVAVHQQQHVPLPFVEVMIAQPIEPQFMRLEGIQTAPGFGRSHAALRCTNYSSFV